MTQVEACLDGDVPDEEGTAGAYALFADVSKAYDQVWRDIDGLYLALYSIGVRGPIWKIIWGWLDGASACTTWTGVHGPSAPLAEGLRRGCVLSPILYTVFWPSPHKMWASLHAIVLRRWFKSCSPRGYKMWTLMKLGCTTHT